MEMLPALHSARQSATNLSSMAAMPVSVPVPVPVPDPAAVTGTEGGAIAASQPQPQALAQPQPQLQMQPQPAWLLPAALLGVVLGAAVQVRQAALCSWQAYALVLCGTALVALGVFRQKTHSGRRMHWARTVLLALAVAGMVFGLTGWRAAHFAGQAMDPALEGRDLRVTGVVTSMVQPIEDGGGLRLRLAVESAALQDGGQAVALPARVEVGWYGSGWGGAGEEVPAAFAPPATLRPGQRWRLTLRLKAPHGERNPHGFDYELRQWELGVQATGYVRTSARDARPELLDSSRWRHPVEQLRQSVRGRILARLGSSSGPDRHPQALRTAGVVAALVTGDQRAIDRADWDVFRATGVSHLVSISGLHITLFAWLAAALVQALWQRSGRLCLRWPAPSAALVGGVLLAGAYALFSGWGVPAQRTVSMLVVAALLRLSGRRWPWPQAWLLTCAAVVLPDPWALWQPGFWLSFVAVAVLFSASAIKNEAASASRTGVRGRFVSLLREQWVVTLALTPLTLLLFGQVSVVGLLANLLASPWVTLVVTPLSFAGVLWAPLWQGAGWSVQLLGMVLQALAALPGATAWVAAAPLWAGLAAVAGGVLLALRLPWQVRTLGLALWLPVLLWQAPRPATGSFELLALDVGQGNAVLVRTATHALLYDTGPRHSATSDAGARVLVPLLRALGERLDMVMLSHRDSDHTGGAVAVLAQQTQAALVGSLEDGHPLEGLRPVQPCQAGQRWQWDGVSFEVLHPLAGAGAPVAGGRLPSPNTLSCVLRIASQQGAVALLAGDIEKKQEQALVARAAPLSAHVLLVPHHGSKTSSSAAFLDAVQPRSALVQAAYRSRYGHPAAQVLQRYRERGITVVDSARCGAASWHSERPGEVRCERTEQPRYWQHRIAP